MENRIKIGDVWYVREEQPVEEIKVDAASYNGRVFETDLYCFQATQLLKDDGTPYENCDIEVTDKRVSPWKTENVDNPIWIIGVLNNKAESMDEAHKMFCNQGIAEFRAFIKDLIRVDWLKTIKND